MLNVYDIKKSYANLSGTSEKEAAKFEHLFVIAKYQIESLVNKKEINRTEYIILTNLCAALVNCWVAIQQNSNSSLHSFTSNGFKLKRNSTSQIKSAKLLFMSLRLGAVDLLKDDGFSIFASLNSFKGCSTN